MGLRGARSPHASHDQLGAFSVADVIANVRKATVSRLGFAAVMATLSLMVLPLAYAAAWVGFLAIWELALRLRLEDALAARARYERIGFRWLAAIHFVGGLAYTLYPVTAWSTGAPIGMVLATAWVCGSANHVFVYFTPNRLLLAACLGPLAACALVAPFTVAGFTPTAFVGAAALAALILGACMFGQDRRVLLGSLAKHAAARDAAEQANAAKSQFLATMSHELRTPLNAVIGYAELIEEEAAKGPVAEDAAKIRASARQLLGVIDVILDLSRLETGSIELKREPVLGSALLEQLRESVLPLAAANRNTITIHEATPLGEAEIDHRRLYQCLLQLISNANKFTQDGAITVAAARRSMRGRSQLVFEVTDTGIGIAPEQQSRMFEAFAQGETNAARRYEGAGLGLTLVQRLARLMGGDVGCDSAPGKGSVFTLWVDAGPAEL
jgi:signal transduction histidine kinase